MIWFFGTRVHSALWPVIRQFYETSGIGSRLGVEMIYVSADSDLKFVAKELPRGMLLVNTF